MLEEYKEISEIVPENNSAKFCLNFTQFQIFIFTDTGFPLITTIDNQESFPHFLYNSKTIGGKTYRSICLFQSGEAIPYQLQKSSKITIHQYDRKNNSWVQSEKDEGITASIEDEKNTGKNKLAVLLSTSAKINDKLVFKSIERSECDVICISASSIGLGSPLYGPDIERIVDFLFDKLIPLASCYESIHLFAAVPAALAVEIGRNLQKTLFSNVFTYHFCNQRYQQAIIINPQKKQSDSSLTSPDNIIEISNNRHNIISVPIIGQIACGEISDAILESSESYPIPESVLGHGQFFILEADGDSMVNAGIDEGDYVVVRKQDTAEVGQIVVARVDDKSSLKRYYLDPRRKKIILHPENESYEDQTFDEVDIQGIAKMVIKALH